MHPASQTGNGVSSLCLDSTTRKCGWYLLKFSEPFANSYYYLCQKLWQLCNHLLCTLVRKTTGILCHLALWARLVLPCAGLHIASQMSLPLFIDPHFAVPMYAVSQSNADACTKTYIHKWVTTTFTDPPRMQGSLILLRSHSLRAKLNHPWGKWEMLLFPWCSVTCETVGVEVHILALKSQTLYKDKIKLGDNLRSKTQEYICTVQRPKSAAFELPLCWYLKKSFNNYT